jgi:hypothetical protein
MYPVRHDLEAYHELHDVALEEKAINSEREQQHGYDVV